MAPRKGLIARAEILTTEIYDAIEHAQSEDSKICTGALRPLYHMFPEVGYYD